MGRTAPIAAIVRLSCCHSLGLASARAAKPDAEMRAATTSPSATADAERSCPGSRSAISPTCWPAVLTAISRPETRMETTPARMEYRPLPGADSSMMLEPGWNVATSTQLEIALAMAASPPAIG